jgi:hypothetical protein
MIKDPLNQQETPYDILDIDVNTPTKDLHQALPRFMKKNRMVSKIAVAQEAIRKLKNMQERIALDISYYWLEVVEISSIDSICDISRLASDQLTVPLINPDNYLVDLVPGSVETEFPEYQFMYEVTATIPVNYDARNNNLFMPVDDIEIFMVENS